MLSKDRIIEHFDRSLGSGERVTDPYLLYNFAPFPEDVYPEILKHMPEDDRYFEMKHPEAIRPDGSSARLELQLEPGPLKRLPAEQKDFWSEMNGIFRSDELRDVFKRWLEPELTKRFGCALREIPAFPAPVLLRDSYGYKISVHPDTEAKVITTQFYFPSDFSQRHLGTNIHRRAASGRQFDLVQRLDFSPNRGYCFAVSKHSWHSVNPMTPSDGKRNSLMLLYMKQPGMSY